MSDAHFTESHDASQDPCQDPYLDDDFDPPESTGGPEPDDDTKDGGTGSGN